MFVPLTESERQAFLSQTSGSHIPGYTGHCPTLKFRFGRCYGANTKEIMQELRDQGVLRSVRREQYRSDDPTKAVLNPISYKREVINPSDEIRNRGSKYILGYTGYIPGMNFRYGKSYSRAADDSMYEFANKQMQMRQKWEADQIQRANSAPKMVPVRSQDEVMRTLRDYEEKFKYKTPKISPEYPPIAGYTGHIPRVKGNEASLSQRYHCVAKQGLARLQEDRNRRHNLVHVQEKINSILDEAEQKYKRN